MSYYEKIKAIRLPVPKELFGKDGKYYNGHSIYESVYNFLDFEEDYSNIFGDDVIGRFTIHTAQRGKCYIDYLLDYEFASSEGEYDKAYNLTEEEIKQYVPIFNQLGFNYNIEDLRKVEYCYYNGVNAPDCYEVENITENNSITIVYPTYYDRKTHADVRLIGKGVAFTDKAKAMEYQEYMNKNIGSKWDTEYGYVFWDNQIIKLNPDKEEWQKDCDRWNRRLEEE